ncbi:MAG: DUF488 domain-containing protein [Gemmataceae bacterium]|nr:DUF488 domain-containing protein [Gemmataceae bacterium]
MPLAVFTIGRSNHPLNRFLALLAQHYVEALVNIQHCPGSRKYPHFNRTNLAGALPQSGVAYHWLEALGGGRAKQRNESPNLGLDNQGILGYAEHMLTDEFPEGLEKLLEVARRGRTAIIGAEGPLSQCQRRLVSRFLVGNGVTVLPIIPAGELRMHTMTIGAVVEDGRVTYPGEESLST